MGANFRGLVRALLARLGVRRERGRFRLTPPTFEAIQEIAEREGRPWEQVAGDLIVEGLSLRWTPEERQEVWNRLTERGREVLELASQGYSYHEIGERLGISPHTVKNHLQRIYELSAFATRKEDLERMFADWDWGR